ncbi:NADH dehydrogenase subunit [Leptospira gomenensis]|uniref:NADH-quinone oxidoreductase subunit J n=1 Tax=Leptospira gomenensis TaxID=2484974 RepID=A0A5F1Y814_9LEPT|nr:NADH-quinone oxidoreductase subunit J [Leptospira gomenensis]TGK28985.1 NADH dehydrogenase subunit [Leptospira gomenensis]TGK32808.1 NADH dehydrogenase subunit [Leptospira gomenensis]TGK40744.1 NADH dehydrogenase subunit [Leptospira gomenensis]TGK68412.1 NADH dehydrogenase subunit [Leptospira gomenensis]
MPFTDQPQLLLFFLFASVMVLSSLGVIFHPNAISAAVLLVLSFFSLAAIYAVMNAIFIATMQILVYAGAIMVLVVFVLMLLSLRDETQRLFFFEKPIKKFLYLSLVAFLGVLLVTAVQDGIPSRTAASVGYAQTKDGEFAGYSFRISKYEIVKNQKGVKESGSNPAERATIPNVSAEGSTNPDPVHVSGNTAVVGSAMFLRYLLPFELISVLLLTAVLGVVVLGKKNPGKNENGGAL